MTPFPLRWLVVLLLIVLSILSSLPLFASVYYISTSGPCVAAVNNGGDTGLNIAFSLLGTFGSIKPNRNEGSDIAKNCRQNMVLRAQHCSGGGVKNVSPGDIGLMENGNPPADSSEMLNLYMSNVPADDVEPDSKLFGKLTTRVFIIPGDDSNEKKVTQIKNQNEMTMTIGDVVKDYFSPPKKEDSKTTWKILLINDMPELGFFVNVGRTKHKDGLTHEERISAWDVHVVMTNVLGKEEFDLANFKRPRFNNLHIGTNRINFYTPVSIGVQDSGKSWAIVSTSTGVRFAVSEEGVSRSIDNSDLVDVQALMFKMVRVHIYKGQVTIKVMEGEKQVKYIRIETSYRHLDGKGHYLYLRSTKTPNGRLPDNGKDTTYLVCGVNWLEMKSPSLMTVTILPISERVILERGGVNYIAPSHNEKDDNHIVGKRFPLMNFYNISVCETRFYKDDLSSPEGDPFLKTSGSVTGIACLVSVAYFNNYGELERVVLRTKPGTVLFMHEASKKKKKLVLEIYKTERRHVSERERYRIRDGDTLEPIGDCREVMGNEIVLQATGYHQIAGLFRLDAETKLKPDIQTKYFRFYIKNIKQLSPVGLSWLPLEWSDKNQKFQMIVEEDEWLITKTLHPPLDRETIMEYNIAPNKRTFLEKRLERNIGRSVSLDIFKVIFPKVPPDLQTVLESKAFIGTLQNSLLEMAEGTLKAEKANINSPRQITMLQQISMLYGSIFNNPERMFKKPDTQLNEALNAMATLWKQFKQYKITTVKLETDFPNAATINDFLGLMYPLEPPTRDPSPTGDSSATDGDRVCGRIYQPWK